MLTAIINFSCNIFYFFISAFPFFLYFKRKQNFKIIILIFLLGLLAYVPFVSSFVDLVSSDFQFIYWSAVSLINAIIVIAFFLIAYEENKGKRIFYIATGYLIFFIIMAISSLFQELYYFVKSEKMPDTVVILINISISLLVAIANFFIFQKGLKIYQGKSELKYTLTTILLNVVFTAILAYVPNVVLSDKESIAKITMSAISILFGYMSLFSHSILIKKENDQMEKEKLKRETMIQEKVLNEKIKQYEIAQNVIDLVNIKYHDLKHRFGDISFEKDNITQQIVQELTSGIDLYDTYIHTGNEPLDVILTELNMQAHKNDVLVEMVVDGSCLSFLSVGELYSLFGNTIDNSLNYLQTLNDKDKRFIRVNARKEKNMSVIHIENYYEGEKINNKIIKTTSNEHGFGLKSIKMIARKYNGDISFETSNNLFVVNIILFEPK